MIHRHIFETSVTVKSSFVIHANSKQGSKSKCSIYTIVGIKWNPSKQSLIPLLKRPVEFLSIILSGKIYRDRQMLMVDNP